jgi:hypothetical protein
MKGRLLVATLLVCCALTSAHAQIGAGAGGAAALTAGNIQYRVIDGAMAKRVASVCASTWLDDAEVLLIEYRQHTYLLRTGFGDIGRACRID